MPALSKARDVPSNALAMPGVVYNSLRGFIDPPFAATL
jgi:hypothetical protein